MSKDAKRKCIYRESNAGPLQLVPKRIQELASNDFTTKPQMLHVLQDEMI